MAPFYDRFTEHHDYEAWTRDARAARGCPRPERPAPARRRLRHGQELPAVPRPRLRRGRMRPVAADGGARGGEGARRRRARLRRRRAAAARRVRPRLLPRRLPEPPARPRLRSSARSAGSPRTSRPAGSSCSTSTRSRPIAGSSRRRACTTPASWSWSGRGRRRRTPPQGCSRPHASSRSRALTTEAGRRRGSRIASATTASRTCAGRSRLPGSGAPRLYGQGVDGIPHPRLRELADTKAVYVARHAR